MVFWDFKNEYEKIKVCGPAHREWKWPVQGPNTLVTAFQPCRIHSMYSLPELVILACKCYHRNPQQSGIQLALDNYDAVWRAEQEAPNLSGREHIKCICGNDCTRFGRELHKWYSEVSYLKK